MTSKSGGLRLSREVLNVIVAADQHQHLPQLEPLSKFDKFEAGTLSATKSSTSRQRDLWLNKTTCIFPRRQTFRNHKMLILGQEA
jgi:hypothetical protein